MFEEPDDPILGTQHEPEHTTSEIITKLSVFGFLLACCILSILFVFGR